MLRHHLFTCESCQLSMPISTEAVSDLRGHSERPLREEFLDFVCECGTPRRWGISELPLHFFQFPAADKFSHFWLRCDRPNCGLHITVHKGGSSDLLTVQSAQEAWHDSGIRCPVGHRPRWPITAINDSPTWPDV